MLRSNVESNRISGTHHFSCVYLCSAIEMKMQNLNNDLVNWFGSEHPRSDLKEKPRNFQGKDANLLQN